MSEYIERETLLKKLGERLKKHEYDECTELTIYEDMHEVKEVPAADVAPVRHGRWIEPSRLYYGAKQYECSLCCSDTFWKKHNITEKYPHCPNCGAKMDLED